MSLIATKGNKDLQELVRIVSSVAPKKLKVFSINRLETSESRVGGLFRSLKYSPSSEDGNTYAALIGVDPESQPYKLVKSRLKQSLLWNLLNVDLKRANYSKYLQKSYEVQQWGFICKILGILGARQLAATYARVYLNKAVVLEEWSAALDLLTLLRSDAAASGRRKDFARYAQRRSEIAELLEANDRAEVWVQRIQIAFTISGSEQPELVRELRLATEEVTGLSQRHQSFKLTYTALRVRAMLLQIENNYFETLDVSNEALALLDQYPQFDNRARRLEYEAKKLYCYVRLSDHLRASQSVQRCTDLVRESENNWFPIKELEYQSLMHRELFEEAVAVYRAVRSNPRFETQPESARQRWQLYGLYADYASGRPISVQSLKGFLASMPAQSADKAGYNVAVLILHILLLLENRDYSSVLERIQALKIYRKRYLKGKENSQTDIFFRSLVLLDSSFDRRVVQSRATRLAQKLDAKVEEAAIQGVQILTYAWIWKRILSRLQESR